MSRTAERPRLCVFRSNRGIEAQLIDDLEAKTLAAASWLNLKKGFKGNKTEQATEVGKQLAANAKKAGLELVSESTPVPTHFIAVFVVPEANKK